MANQTQNQSGIADSRMSDHNRSLNLKSPGDSMVASSMLKTFVPKKSNGVLPFVAFVFGIVLIVLFVVLLMDGNASNSYF